MKSMKINRKFSVCQMSTYTGPGAKRPKDANKPKRAQSAYFLFLADFRAREKDNFQYDGGHKDLIKAGMLNHISVAVGFFVQCLCRIVVFS